MNELEKQIVSKFNAYGRDNFNGATDFKAGCDFILEKNLPVLFADWKEENENEEALHDLFFESNQEIYDYWLNNVYGK